MDEYFVQCPECSAEIAYDDVLEADHNPALAKCPECGAVSPTDEFFS